MRRSDVRIGMKVIPHKKTTGYREFGECVAWKSAQDIKQPFLYVTGATYIHGKIAFRLWHKEEDNGDFFDATDFDVYRRKK